MRSLMLLARRRWRLLAAIACGVAVYALTQERAELPGAAPLAGWVAGAGLFVVTTAAMFFTSDEAVTRAHAAQEDENRGILTGLILLAVCVSLWVAFVAIRDSRFLSSHQVRFGQPLLLWLAVSTLVLSWLMAQCLFVLHYAHRYFGDADADGATDGGIVFPGEAPKTYRDFIYVAVCVGATCQVSDFNITTCRFRGLVTAHALFSFAFNTMVLALGINILASLLGQ